MPYLDYETYAALGGTVPEDEFYVAEGWAEAWLDLWTLNRLHVVDWSEWEHRVQLVMTRLVDGRADAMAQEGATPLASFSNGRDSFTFADPEANTALAALNRYAVDVLPVELVSACVAYNGAS